MLLCHTTGCYVADHFTPSVYDNYSTKVLVDSKSISVGLWDTAGGEDHDRLRPLSYANADVFVVCYSIDSQASFENVGFKWVPEIRRVCPDKPFLLVGTKSDIREDKYFIDKLKSKGGDGFVDTERAKQTGAELGAASVMECSAKKSVGVTEVFDEAVKVALAFRHRPVKKKKCLLL